MDYVELEVTSNFSFLRGGSHPEELVEQAAALAYKQITISDHSSFAGLVRAHSAAKKHNISLISGCRINFGSPDCSLLLYPTNREAYGRLSTLLTTGKLRAAKGECRLTLEDIAAFEKDILAIFVIEEINNANETETSCKKLKDIFSEDRLSLAIRSTYNPRHAERLLSVSKLAKTFAVPLVATNDVHYHQAERRQLQDVLTCIRLNTSIDKAGFELLQNAERYLKPQAEMARMFRNFPQAILRTKEIAERASGFSLDQLSYEYPQEICPQGISPFSYLSKLVEKGAKERYPQGLPQEVATQIQHELKLIHELAYEKYFLTVYDIVSFARSQNILCQGRGAAANSAVCYALGITAVDPSQIKLLFERFVSKERNEPPDIDIDFEHERREEVIQYIYQKFGRHRAALVSEVITYRTKSAFRDVGKALGLKPEQIELLLKIKTRSGDFESKLNLPIDEHKIQLLISLSQTIRSFPRHLSQHVGGFVISDKALSEIVPIENANMPERTVIEWDKDDIDTMGMLKIDILGLGMLSCIRKALELINSYSEEKFSLYSIPREDPAVYQMLSRAETIGVFQVESRAQMSMLPRLQPRSFYDLVIEVAIVRPGPIQGGMVHPYLRRRNGEEKISYPSPAVRSILERTLGVPIFQEQVMELAIVAAGFSPGEADQLRRAMGAWGRNSNKLLAFEEKFKGGMLRNGYSKDFADRLFEQTKGFGEYGFPQSHSASFALLVYVSAWIKKYHPAAFAAALLNSQPMGFYQPAQIIEDAKQNGVFVLGVDVNYSAWNSLLESKNHDLRLGMRLVKGLQEKEAEKIFNAVRTHNKFSSILSLWRASKVHVSSLRSLAHADAFQSLGLNRQQALWQIKKLRDDPLPLFDTAEDREEEISLPLISEKLEVLRDYQTLGLSLKAHPLSFIRKQLEHYEVLQLKDFKNPRIAVDGQRVKLAGLVLLRQRPSTAAGIMFMTLEDETGMANLIIKPQVLQKFLNTLLDSTILLVAGKTQRQSEILHLILEEAIDVSRLYVGFEQVSRDFH